MNYLKNCIQAGKTVYQNKGYLGITVFSSLILFSFNALFRNWRILWENFSLKLFFSLIGGIFTSFSPASLFLLIISDLLAVIVVTFSIFLIKRQVAERAENAEASLPGLILSILLPACPSCALSIFGLIGVGSSLAFLPLQGLEFGLLTIGVILISLSYLAKKITAAVCEIKT